jgi:hypothetical protein
MPKLSDGTIISSAFRGSDVKLKHGHDQLGKVSNLKVGTIIAVRTVDSTEGLQLSGTMSSEGPEGVQHETVYDVRVDDNNYRPFIFYGCRALKPFMGANNYFDMIHEAADMSATYVESAGPVGGVFASAPSSLMGSRCVLLCVEGNPTAPIILGFVQHPGRKSKITKAKGVHLEFEFNGLSVQVDKDGAFKLESNGPYIPTITNPVGLGDVPEGVLRQNPLAGPLTVEIDSNMNFSLKNNVGQQISLNRLSGVMEFGNGSDFFQIAGSLIPGQGEIIVNAGKAMTFSSLDGVFGFQKSLTLNALDCKISADVTAAIEAGSFSLTSQLGVDVSATNIKLEAKVSFQVQATTISIKGATGELLATIKELIDGIAACTPLATTGPCSPMQASPQWDAGVVPALIKLQGMIG